MARSANADAPNAMPDGRSVRQKSPVRRRHGTDIAYERKGGKLKEAIAGSISLILRSGWGFAATHRLSTIAHLDRILVFDNGSMEHTSAYGSGQPTA